MLPLELDVVFLDLFEFFLVCLESRDLLGESLYLFVTLKQLLAVVLVLSLELVAEFLEIGFLSALIPASTVNAFAYKHSVDRDSKFLCRA